MGGNRIFYDFIYRKSRSRPGNVMCEKLLRVVVDYKLNMDQQQYG